MRDAVGDALFILHFFFWVLAAFLSSGILVGGVVLMGWCVSMAWRVLDGGLR